MVLGKQTVPHIAHKKKCHTVCGRFTKSAVYHRLHLQYARTTRISKYCAIKIRLLLLHSVTYSCHDLQGPDSSFMEYLSEELTYWKHFSFNFIYKTVHKRALRSQFLFRSNLSPFLASACPHLTIQHQLKKSKLEMQTETEPNYYCSLHLHVCFEITKQFTLCDFTFPLQCIWDPCSFRILCCTER